MSRALNITLPLTENVCGQFEHDICLADLLSITFLNSKQLFLLCLNCVNSRTPISVHGQHSHTQEHLTIANNSLEVICAFNLMHYSTETKLQNYDEGTKDYSY